MHTKKTYKFDTEAKAKAFAQGQKNYLGPDVDLYVSVPFFVDEAVVFKGVPGGGDAQYWQVTVECFA